LNETRLRWNLQACDLLNLNPAKARDLVTQCLREAQCETFAQNEKTLGHKPEEADLNTLAQGAVRLAFREAEEDYDNPSVAALMKVVQVLARKSATWGTPPEIIEHHKRQIARVLECLNNGNSKSAAK